MERFKKIALLYFGQVNDSIVLNRAAALAQSNQAKIEVISVIEPTSSVAQLLLGKEREEQVVEGRRSKLQSALNEHCKHLGIENLSIHFQIGDPAIETIRFILQHDCDLLMKFCDPTDDHQTISPTDRKLLRKCPVPVILLKKDRKEKFSRIMAAVDPEPTPPSKLDLHRNVLQLATSLAKREGAELDVVYVWDSLSYLPLPGLRGKMNEEEISSLVEKKHQIHENHLKCLLSPFTVEKLKISINLVQGNNPAQELIEYTKRQRIDLLVMGTLTRGGLPGMLIGNTAEQVLDKVNCSTLTVKPSDFACPIKI